MRLNSKTCKHLRKVASTVFSISSHHVSRAAAPHFAPRAYKPGKVEVQRKDNLGIPLFDWRGRPVTEWVWRDIPQPMRLVEGSQRAIYKGLKASHRRSA